VSALGEWVKSRRPFWALYPTPRVGAAAFAASVLWLLPGSAGRIAGFGGLALLTLAVAIDYALLPGRKDIAVRREIAETLGLGDRVEAGVDIESGWRRRFRASLTDELPTSFVVDRPEEFTVDAGAAVRVPMPFTPMRRGSMPLGGVALRMRTDLGLVARIARFPLGGEVTIVPSLANVRRFRLLAMQHRLQDVGVRALRRRGEGRSFAGLREYVPGMTRGTSTGNRRRVTAA
jgi:uncharacterized protein (DUF58 family)